MSTAPPAPAPRPAPPFPGIADLITAVRQLTVLGKGDAVLRVDASAVFYPLIGLVLGAVWVGVDRAVEPWAGRIAASVAVVAVAAGLTRARGVQALARAAVVLVERRGHAAAALESAAGPPVWVATAVVLLADVGVLAALGRFRLVGLAFAPLLGCCSMVVLAVGSRAARADGRQVKFAPDVTFREFGIATTATFALLFMTTEFLGLLLVLATAAFSVAARVAWHRGAGGINATALFATAEAVQLMVLALLAALS